MADTTFVKGTVVQPEWLNEVNDFVYGETATGTSLRTAADAATARTTLGATTTGSALFTAADAAAARLAAGVPNSGPLSGLRNLIINGNFSVNQRGYASGSATTGANQYTLDRWRVVTSGQAATFTTTGAGRTVTAPSGGIEQVIEGASIGGGTYVISWTGTASCTVNGVSRTKGATFTLTAGSNATVRFSSGTVTEVQIEPGEVATAFELRPVVLELLLCQRYYEQGTATLQTAAAGNMTVPVPFKVTKRAVPTMTVVGIVSDVSVTGAQYLNIAPDSVSLQIISTAGGGYRDGWQWAASAEL